MTCLFVLDKGCYIYTIIMWRMNDLAKSGTTETFKSLKK